MNVLFVSSGNSEKGISPIIKNQGESLRKNGVQIEYFTIVGKGIGGYLKSIPKLYRFRKAHSIQVYHAHYSLSAFVASLALCRPLVVSLMGSDVKSRGWVKQFIRFFNVISWKVCIVKSEDMKNSLGIRNTMIIPNGINFSLHKELEQLPARKELGWNVNNKHILFAASPKRPEKNFELAQTAFDLLQGENLELHYLENVPHHKLPVYYAASDAVLLTSLWEGSPNVIKEAMACNRPIVSTNVGDVEKVIGRTEGCFVSSFDPEDVAEKLQMALNFNINTRGREAVAHLDDNKVAQQLMAIYNQVQPASKNFS